MRHYSHLELSLFPSEISLELKLSCVFVDYSIELIRHRQKRVTLYIRRWLRRFDVFGVRGVEFLSGRDSGIQPSSYAHLRTIRVSSAYASAYSVNVDVDVQDYQTRALGTGSYPYRRCVSCYETTAVMWVRKVSCLVKVCLQA